MSFCYFKKSHIGFFACIFSSWVNCCDLWGWTAVPSNPFCDGFLHIGCASLAASGFSQQLSTYVSKVAHKCRPTCPQMSTMLSTFVSNRNAKTTSNCRAGMRHGLYSGCPQQSLYALSRKGAKIAKATSNSRGRHEARPLQRMPARIPLCLVSQRRKDCKGHIQLQGTCR